MSVRKTTEQAIADFRKVHGDRYDYSNVHYVNNYTKVQIICREHGVFEQQPRKHTVGNGCHYCGGGIREFQPRHTTDRFVKDAHSIHGSEYSYGKVKYKNNYTKVEIVCQKHGSFFQRPKRHLEGQGCPNCADTSFNPSEPAFVYFLQFEGEDTFFKVGITNNVSRRLKEQRTALRYTAYHGYKVNLVDTLKFEVGSDAKNLEGVILSQVTPYIASENFKGSTELFIADDILQLVASLK